MFVSYKWQILIIKNVCCKKSADVIFLENTTGKFFQFRYNLASYQNYTKTYTRYSRIFLKIKEGKTILHKNGI